MSREQEQPLKAVIATVFIDNVIIDSISLRYTGPHAMQAVQSLETEVKKACKNVLLMSFLKLHKIAVTQLRKKKILTKWQKQTELLHIIVGNSFISGFFVKATTSGVHCGFFKKATTKNMSY